VLSPFFLSLSRDHRDLHSFPTRRSSDLETSRTLDRTRTLAWSLQLLQMTIRVARSQSLTVQMPTHAYSSTRTVDLLLPGRSLARSEEHTSELQSRENLVCRLLLEKKKKK